MECGDSSPLFGEGFSLHHLAVGPDGTTTTHRGWNPTLQSTQWRDLLVRSDRHRSMTHRPSPGTTSVPLRLFGGTCLSGPPLNVGSSIPFCRGLKSRAESGAKAPHSIWSAAIHRRFLVKALAFTNLPSARMARRRPIGGGTRPSNPHNGGTLLVGSDQHRSMTHRPSPGTTSVPLRLFGGTCL